jgi:SulP family sulfate permease
LQPRQILPVLVAGLITGTITVTIAAAAGVLIFSGDLAAYIPAGVGVILFGSAVVAGLTALTSSFRGLIASLQDSTIAFLASMAAIIVRAMPPSATPQETFYTMVATISATAFLAGFVLWLLGQFKLGGLIRYIPYPVVGGFLAGSGMLLTLYAISLMAGVDVGLFQLSPLLRPDLWGRLLPGLVFALLLLMILRRYSHALIVPGMLLAAMLVFYVALWLTGTSIPAATAQGWLIQGLPKGGGGLWRPLTPADLALVNWSVVGQQIGGMVVITVISAITLLLNATGIEMATGQTIDVNHDLKAVGISSFVAGLGGGPMGCHVLSESVLVHRMGASSRLVGVVLAGVCAAVSLAGAALLSYLPTFMLGGLLLFLGLDFLVTWLYDAWFELPLADYLIVVLIMGAINVIGFLEGVGLGIVVAVVLFVVSYSRLDVVRHALSGVHYHSNVERPRLYRGLLREKGQWLYILELHGFIFFGTATRLLERVRQRVNDPDLPALHFLVLDVRLVRGLDSSAVLSFTKMKQLAQQQGFTLIFTHLSPQIRRQLGEVLGEAPASDDNDNPLVRVFPDLDHGVAWCEAQMIQTFESVGLAAKPRTLKQELERVLTMVSVPASHRSEQLHDEPSDVVASMWERLEPGDDAASETPREPTGETDLMAYLEPMEVETRAYLIRQGQVADAMYFIETGQVTAQLENEDNGGQTVRLRTMGAGTVVGEMGLYLGSRASASVVADQPSMVYRLSADNLKRMEEAAPEVAAAFHRFVAGLLSERLVNANETLRALLR